MEQLENLDVSKNEISDLSFFSNAVLPNLHQLNLAYNEISDINPVSDAYLPNIKSINSEEIISMKMTYQKT
jgi:Leucine-rich repeat (LRR) protein